MSYAPDPRFALKADLDQLCIAYKQASMAKIDTTADVVGVVEAALEPEQKLTVQEALVQTQAKISAAFSARCTSLEVNVFAMPNITLS